MSIITPLLIMSYIISDFLKVLFYLRWAILTILTGRSMGFIFVKPICKYQSLYSVSNNCSWFPSVYVQYGIF